MSTPAPGRFARHLVYGEKAALPAEGIPFWEIFPYEGDLTRKAIEPPVVPEPPRHGEGGDDCRECERSDDEYVWADEHWRLAASAEAEPLLAFLLKPRGHHDLGDLPPAHAATMGPVLQRVEAAIMGLGDIARVHVNKWGDGGAHLHWWLIARPEGLLQLRGTCLPLWGDVLPKLPQDVWDEAVASVASQMAATGGTAYR